MYSHTLLVRLQKQKEKKMKAEPVQLSQVLCRRPPSEPLAKPSDDDHHSPISCLSCQSDRVFSSAMEQDAAGQEL